VGLGARRRRRERDPDRRLDDRDPLVPEGGGTKLLFTHRDLPTRDSADRHAHGWNHYLERLAVTARGGDPGPDPWLEGAPV